MLDALMNFHFIRPLWLLVLLPLGMLLFAFKARQQKQATAWSKVIDPQLLKHLLRTPNQHKKSFKHWLWLLLWLLICFASAGPTFKKLPSPVIKNQDALVIILDLSLSMMAQDVSPNRLTRAKQKITDILRARKDGQTALVVYAGSAFSVTPLTDDTRNITNLLPSLSPTMMPNLGSRADKAINLAKTLLKNAGQTQGQLLLISDGINQKHLSSITDSIEYSPYSMSIIGIGSKDGAPIPIGNKGFVRDNGKIVMAKFDASSFNQLASSSTEINWTNIALTDEDWQGLLKNRVQQQDKPKSQAKNYFDQYQDMGYWLIIPACGLCLLFFRRGYQFVFVLFFLGLMNPQPAWAFEFSSMFKNKDQQGYELLKTDPKKAAQTFNSPMWKGISHYQAKQYEQAAKAFSQLDSADAHYNRGNALAQMRQYESAISAYEKALKKNPNLEDAKNNIEKVKKALKQQKKQKKQNQKGQNNKDQNQQNKTQKDQQDQNNSSQNNQEQRQKNQDKSSQSRSQKNEQKDNQKAKEQQQSDSEKAKKEQEKQAQTEKQYKPLNEDKGEEDKAQKDKQRAQQTKQTPFDKLSKEEKAAMKQWLNKVPDKPGNLLERKFKYQYNQEQKQQREDELW